jgi:predicted dehydrogenase
VRSLVVGYGSIGARHARILQGIGCTTAVVTRRPVPDVPAYPDVADALARFRPDYVVVANETAMHLATVESLAAAGFDGLVLVEKPLDQAPTALPRHQFRRLGVAYNLRFHPVLQALRQQLGGERVVSVQVYAGQYLPDWRPGSDFRTGYSASRARGGGVLRDLSHEFDYVDWLFGRYRRLAALGGNFGVLQIDSDENWAIVMETERAPLVSIQLNYLDRPGRREIVVNTHRHTIVADLVAARLAVDGTATAFEVGRDDTYAAQHQAMLQGRHEELCTAEDALRVLGTIAAVERAAATGDWLEA